MLHNLILSVLNLSFSSIKDFYVIFLIRVRNANQLNNVILLQIETINDRLEGIN